MELKTKPWRRRNIVTPKPPIVVDAPSKLRARIDIYDDTAMLSRQQGLLWTSYPISLVDLAKTLANIRQAPAMIPEHALVFGDRGQGIEGGIYIPPRPVTLIVETAARMRSYTVPSPGLVWLGRGRHYAIAATKGGRPTPDSPLFCAPFANVFSSGKICWGSAEPRPMETWGDLTAALDLFFASHFNTHLDGDKSLEFPVSIYSQYERLQSACEWPEHDLVPMECTLAEFVKRWAAL